MSRLASGGSRWLLAGLALFCLTALSVVVVFYLKTEGLATAARVAALVALLLAAGPLALGSVRWANRKASAVEPLTSQVTEMLKDVLANKVRTQWEREARALALTDPAPIPVRWKETDQNITDHRRFISATPSAVIGRSDQITKLVVAFKQLYRRRLVIIGDPGSGKTTLAVLLLLHLLKKRSEADRVPVLLTIAGWDTTATPDLSDWLSSKLSEEYPAIRAFGPSAGRILVDQGAILPILDGLDELPEDAQPRVIAALNSSLAERDPIILTSRAEAFAQAVSVEDVLTAAAVIEPDPLTAEDIANYLEDCLQPTYSYGWHRVLSALREGSAKVLADACATPLGVWLLRNTYIANHKSPEPLLDSAQFPNSKKIRDHLLKRLIPDILEAKPSSPNYQDIFRPRHSWHPDATVKWLTFLAVYLDRIKTPDFIWWHLARNTFTHPTFGIGLGIIFGTVGGVGFGLVNGLGFGLLAAVGFALASVFVGKFGCSIEMDPRYTTFKVRGKGVTIVRATEEGLVFGTIGGAIAGFVYWLVNPPLEKILRNPVNPRLQWLPPDFAFGLVVGLAVGLMFGLSVWTQTPVSTADARTPVSTLYLDRRAILSRLAISIFILVASFTILLDSLRAGMAFGMLCALGAWLPASGAWLIYTIAAHRLALAGNLPWKLQAFLEDCYRLGLLRVTGPAYQFRHAELQDHLVRVP